MKGDPIQRRMVNGFIYKFDRLAKRGTEISVNQEIMKSIPFNPNQTRVVFDIYYTKEENAEYCDEPGMMLLGKFTVDLLCSGLDRLLFGFILGQTEITVTAKNENNGQDYVATFVYDLYD